MASPRVSSFRRSSPRIWTADAPSRENGRRLTATADTATAAPAAARRPVAGASGPGIHALGVPAEGVGADVQVRPWRGALVVQVQPERVVEAVEHGEQAGDQGQLDQLVL